MRVYTPPTWPEGISTAERSDLLGALRKHLVRIKLARGLTYRQIGQEAGVKDAEASNAANWQATYPVYKKLAAWVNTQKN